MFDKYKTRYVIGHQGRDAVLIKVSFVTNQ